MRRNVYFRFFTSKNYAPHFTEQTTFVTFLWFIQASEAQSIFQVQLKHLTLSLSATTLLLINVNRCVHSMFCSVSLLIYLALVSRLQTVLVVIRSSSLAECLCVHRPPVVTSLLQWKRLIIKSHACSPASLGESTRVKTENILTCGRFR